MGENFRIGLRAKIRVAVLNQLFLERLIIFNHAIVDEGELAAGIEMRMRIFVGDLAVRGPASVTDSKRTRRRLGCDQFGERGDPPGAFARLDLVMPLTIAMPAES